MSDGVTQLQKDAAQLLALGVAGDEVGTFYESAHEFISAHWDEMADDRALTRSARRAVRCTAYRMATEEIARRN